jgi:hypothetical protein
MTSIEHENYAKDLLSSLSDDHPETEIVNFVPSPRQSRNTASAMTAILCQRLSKKSKHRPIRLAGKTYEWKEGVFNCRNIADRDYLWTNMRRNVANKMHDLARSKTVAYLLACSNPSDAMLVVWSIPEPLLHDSLSSLPPKKGGQEYTILIRTDKQRIEDCAAAHDLTEYSRAFSLSRHELLVLQESREADDSVRLGRKTDTQPIKTPDEEDGEGEANGDAADYPGKGSVPFDAASLQDERRRSLAERVLRPGQKAFRDEVMQAYAGRCAITECNVPAALEAAHIIPYCGTRSDHVSNGILLRIDLHALFDAYLISINPEDFRVQIESTLEGGCYEFINSRRLRLPEEIDCRPHPEALTEHYRIFSSRTALSQERSKRGRD